MKSAESVPVFATAPDPYSKLASPVLVMVRVWVSEVAPRRVSGTEGAVAKKLGAAAILGDRLATLRAVEWTYNFKPSPDSATVLFTIFGPFAVLHVAP